MFEKSFGSIRFFFFFFVYLIFRIFLIKFYCFSFQVICTVETAMIEKGIPTRPVLKPDIMPAEYREGDLTQRNVRDWMTLRDYMNGLKDIIELFSHYRDKLDAQKSQKK